MRKLNDGRSTAAGPSGVHSGGRLWRGEDTRPRQALEREALERELELALQPGYHASEPELTDVPLETPELEPQAPPRRHRSAPSPAPRQRRRRLRAAPSRGTDSRRPLRPRRSRRSRGR